MEKGDQKKKDEYYMHRALQLARCGHSGVAPNPMVGAVVVAHDRIIGEGFHQCYGQAHAEVNAISSVRERELLTQSTIYVTLEPCAHYGKTPPCADLIIRSGIPRVVVGCKDNFGKVDGKGIARLRDAGCEVVVGILEKECLALNRAFFVFHGLQRPYVMLKWAQSADGFVDIYRKEGDGQQPICFSTPLTQTLVHALRADCDAILIGGRTALLDNPTLTTRLWPGSNPLRVVLDTRGNLPATLTVFSDSFPTIRYQKTSLEAVLRDLHGRGVQRLLVEGGAATLETFIAHGFWDIARVEFSPQLLYRGIPAPSFPEGSRVVELHELDNNHIVFFENNVAF